MHVDRLQNRKENRYIRVYIRITILERKDSRPHVDTRERICYIMKKYGKCAG